MFIFYQEPLSRASICWLMKQLQTGRAAKAVKTTFLLNNHLFNITTWRYLQEFTLTALMKNIWDVQMNLNPEETTTDQTVLFAAG